ncbi:MAG: nucleotidyltransferase family protein [Candidatus Diapherotrites archaeon]
MENEQKLLLLCARSRLGERERAEIARLLSSPLNWEKIKKLAGQQGMVPLLHNSLSKFKGRVPQDVMEELHNERKKIVRHNMLVFSRARGLLLALKKNKIPAIIPKGISTAQKFSDDGLKQVGDIDLLIRRVDIGALEQVLARQGWLAVHDYAKTKEQRLKNGCQLPQFAIEGATLDTHWELNYFVRPEESDLWGDAVPFRLDGAKALQLSPEKQVCYLCLHSGFSHGMQSLLRDLVDINETIEYYCCGKGKAIDWQKLSSTAERWKVSAAVYFCLRMVREKEKFGNMHVPEKTLASLREKSNKPQLLVLDLLGDRLLAPLPQNQMRVFRLFLRQAQRLS